MDLTKYTEAHEFAFDDAYPEDVGNDEIYATTVIRFVGTIFDSSKVTCFAYGQTGSGKIKVIDESCSTRAAGEIFEDGARATVETRVGAVGVSLRDLRRDRCTTCERCIPGKNSCDFREDARSQMRGGTEFQADNVDLVVQRFIEHGTARRARVHGLRDGQLGRPGRTPSAPRAQGGGGGPRERPGVRPRPASRRGAGARTTP